MKKIGLEVKENLDEDTRRASILRYFHTIRFLKSIQIYGRVWITIKRTALKPIIIWRANEKSPASTVPELGLVHKPFNKDLLKCQVNNREFVFLNKKMKYPNSINWNDDRIEKLWLYNLHYFEYLLPLTLDYSKQNFLTGKSIIIQWIEDNPTGYGNGWESYPLSLRIVNWIFFFDRYYAFFEKDDDFRTVFLANLHRQACYLEFFLEIHLLANHFFENIKSLLFAAIFFQARKLFKKTWKLLRREIQEQILEDGGHYERSPMYHSIILTDILDVLNVLRSSKDALSRWLSSEEQAGIASLETIAGKMLEWLAHMIHPDGEIALFGDSAFGIAPSARQIRDYFERIEEKLIEPPSTSNSLSLPPSGYFIFRDNSQYLVIDGGELGVRYQSGHVHCDLLSYEYSYKGIRFIVDSGVGSYQNVELRNKARSIRSHNTVVINGLEQAELWMIHRVGRRVNSITSQLDTTKNSFTGQYKNSLYPNQTYKHTRRITFVSRKFFFVEDQIEGESLRSIESLIHFHPECEFELKGGSLRITIKAQSVFILWDDQRIDPEIREWFHVPEFGKVIDSNKLVLKASVANDRNLGYVISPLEYLNNAREYLSKISR